MRIGVLILGMMVLVSMGGCEDKSSHGNIPMQDYVNGIAAFGVEKGDIRGVIKFPHEYEQRSSVFMINGKTFVSHLDGRFWVSNVPQGQYRLEINIEGYDPIVTEMSVPGKGVKELGTLQLKPSRGRVFGRLVEESGQSAVGLSVRLAPTGKMVVTDQDGVFQFMGVSKGNYVVTLQDGVYFTANRHVKLQGNTPENLGNIKIFRQESPQSRAVGLRSN